MTPYEACVTFLAIKNHFTQKKYDYFKYQGKVRLSHSSFEKRKDKFFFAKLAKMDDIPGYVVANIVENPSTWIGEIINSPSSKKTYTEWKKRNQSLQYIFTNEIKNIETIKDAIVVNDGQHPFLLRLFLQKKISMETLIILIDCLGCLSYWKKELKDDTIWNEWVCPLIVKYKPFMHYNKETFRKIVKEQVKIA